MGVQFQEGEWTCLANCGKRGWVCTYFILRVSNVVLYTVYSIYRRGFFLNELWVIMIAIAIAVAVAIRWSIMKFGAVWCSAVFS